MTAKGGWPAKPFSDSLLGGCPKIVILTDPTLLPRRETKQFPNNLISILKRRFTVPSLKFAHVMLFPDFDLYCEVASVISELGTD